MVIFAGLESALTHRPNTTAGRSHRRFRFVVIGSEASCDELTTLARSPFLKRTKLRLTNFHRRESDGTVSRGRTM